MSNDNVKFNFFGFDFQQDHKTHNKVTWIEFIIDQSKTKTLK